MVARSLWSLNGSATVLMRSIAFCSQSDRSSAFDTDFDSEDMCFGAVHNVCRQWNKSRIYEVLRAAKCAIDFASHVPNCENEAQNTATHTLITNDKRWFLSAFDDAILSLLRTTVIVSVTQTQQVMFDRFFVSLRRLSVVVKHRRRGKQKTIKHITTLARCFFMCNQALVNSSFDMFFFSGCVVSSLINYKRSNRHPNFPYSISTGAFAANECAQCVFITLNYRNGGCYRSHLKAISSLMIVLWCVSLTLFMS